MKRITLSALTATMLALPSVAAAGDWTLDAAHSQASFSVRHMMISNVRGDFTGISGTVDFDEKKATNTKIDVAIDVATLDTRDAKRDGHLKSPDFFDVAKHPKMTFKSKKIRKSGKNYKVAGDLTIHGVTKPVTLLTTISKPTKSPWGQTVVGVQATTTINRKDFGLTWNKALETGGVVVGEKVEITIDAELVKAASKPTASK